MIGNSRLHWACFEGGLLCQQWDAAHLTAEQVVGLLLALEQGSFSPAVFWPEAELPQSLALPAACPLWIASVVPAQTGLWQTYRAAQILSLADIPLAGLYPTLGIDRGLALLGAALVYGLPSLVIDAGTGLTLTGADASGCLVGGAILPGLRLQLRSLADQTPVLPELSQPAPTLPQRWSSQTAGAIWSGVLYTLLAGLRDFLTDWQRQFPSSSLLFTGGDAALLHGLLSQQSPKLAEQITVDPNLIFWGMRQAKTARGSKGV